MPSTQRIDAQAESAVPTFGGLEPAVRELVAGLRGASGVCLASPHLLPCLEMYQHRHCWVPRESVVPRCGQERLGPSPGLFPLSYLRSLGINTIDGSMWMVMWLSAPVRDGDPSSGVHTPPSLSQGLATWEGFIWHNLSALFPQLIILIPPPKDFGELCKRELRLQEHASRGGRGRAGLLSRLGPAQCVRRQPRSPAPSHVPFGLDVEAARPGSPHCKVGVYLVLCSHPLPEPVGGEVGGWLRF